MANVSDAPPTEARTARVHGPDQVAMHAPAVATCEVTTGLVEQLFEEATSNDSRVQNAGWMANVPDAQPPEAIAGPDVVPEPQVRHAQAEPACEATAGLLEITEVWQARVGWAD
jgi:hypothetical protein